MDSSSPQTLYLSVVFNRPLDGSYTYLAPEVQTTAAAGVAKSDAAGVSKPDAPEEIKAPGPKDSCGGTGSPAIVLGRRVVATLGRQKLTGYVVGESDTRPGDLPEGITLKPVLRIIDDEPVFTPELVELSRWIARSYLCSPGEALSAMIPGGRQDRELPALGGDEEGFGTGTHQPSPAQQAAVESICREKQGFFYLYGITGSGKTEVFLAAAERTLREGRSVMYLVPEISLTGQVVDLIRARFSENAAVLHSRLTASQRIAEWRRILRGEARFVIGARSAVFAPVQNLGLIIIDEEHESSYKSGSTPRYHARQVAMYRSSSQGARLVMGSATPSVEAWHHMNEGSITRLNLGERLSGGSLPAIRIVNMRGIESSISPLLRDQMRTTLDGGNQVILFLNRRGFGYFYHCRSCGHDFSCTRCSVSLTYHRENRRLVCHHCGYHSAAPSSCPGCGSLDLGFSGFGTERVEEDVKNLFPLARIERIDTDSVKKKGSLEASIDDFRKGKIDILLGTQMVAKGLNFPGVSLVGIILADSSLHLPDFRSYEKTFALLTQVAGRAGRFRKDGQVIIQTLNPSHHVIRQSADHDIDGFYARELTSRRELRFPPFSRVLRVLVRGREEKAVWQLAGVLGEALRRLVSRPGYEGSEILGPAESPIAIINHNYRVHIMILAPRLGIFQSALPGMLKEMRIPASLYVELDVDPQSLL